MKMPVSFALVLCALAAPFAALAGNTQSLDPACTPGTLAQYEALANTRGAGCSIGFLNFESFSFSQLSGPETASDIMVDPAVNGFMFSRVAPTGQVAPPFLGPAHYQILYNFFIDPAPVVDGADLSLDPPVNPVNITQYYCLDGTIRINSDGFPDCSSDFLYTLRVDADNRHDQMTFQPGAMVGGSVLTDIRIGTGGQFDGIIGNANVTGTPDAPEPVSFGLAGLGLGLLAWKKRKASRPA